MSMNHPSTTAPTAADQAAAEAVPIVTPIVSEGADLGTPTTDVAPAPVAPLPEAGPSLAADLPPAPPAPAPEPAVVPAEVPVSATPADLGLAPLPEPEAAGLDPEAVRPEDQAEPVTTEAPHGTNTEGEAIAVDEHGRPMNAEPR